LKSPTVFEIADSIPILLHTCGQGQGAFLGARFALLAERHLGERRCFLLLL